MVMIHYLRFYTLVASYKQQAYIECYEGVKEADISAMQESNPMSQKPSCVDGGRNKCLCLEPMFTRFAADKPVVISFLLRFPCLMILERGAPEADSCASCLMCPHCEHTQVRPNPPFKNNHVALSHSSTSNMLHEHNSFS